MIHFNKLTIALTVALALSTTSNSAHAQSQNLQEKMKNYFLQTLKTRQGAELKSKADYVRNTIYSTDIQKQIKAKDISDNQKMVWTAWCDANRELQEQKLMKPESLQKGNHASWNLPQELEPNAIMPYYYGVKGKADGKLPLFLYLHGSGPKAQEWQTGLLLGNRFKDAPSLYFIPQIPNESSYRWWQLAKQFAWEKLIRQALADETVDANRLYIFGISEGGYGSQRLASFYADYWAAAGPMAGGEPLKNAPVENCANIGFSFLTGADDTGFYRNILTHYTQTAFDSAQLYCPLSADNQPLFRHRINLLPGMQHRINYDLTTPWLKNFVRNPYPKTVLWEDFEMDGRHRSGFYNLQVSVRPSKNRTYYDMTVNGNVIAINISDAEYTTVEKDKQWGIEMKFNRSYKQAKGGKLRIYLNNRLVDMNKPVTVIVNGRQLYRGKVKATLQDMINSCAEYFDPCRIFPASVEVSY
ncbi:carboxylesterase family protein [Prevotella falsenii]|uniref:carboxylesterase family protein n=1 Tax=Prevotella falsenii TaxID=515414 RepID=UPI0004695999|nr:hypothetical protein [Prevotella falsenii]